MNLCTHKKNVGISVFLFFFEEEEVHCIDLSSKVLGQSSSPLHG